MVRQKFIRTINESIDGTKRFSITDFSIQWKEYTEKGVNELLEIRYLHHDDYYMKIFIPVGRSTITQKDYLNQNVTHADYIIDCEICPGEFKLVEKIKITGADNVIKQLKDWLALMWDELMAIPINIEITKLRDTVEGLFDKVNSIPDEFFSDQEKRDFEQKLVDLEKNFQDHLYMQDLEKEELGNKIKNLHKEIEALRETMSVLKKHSWFKSLAGKIVIWTSKPENQKMLIDGARTIKGFIQNKND